MAMAAIAVPIAPRPVAIRAAAVTMVDDSVTMVGLAVALAPPSSRMTSNVGAVAFGLQSDRLNKDSSQR
ncbi:MAG: hypothetical protein ACM3SX_05135, partial [Deltaproteobacteria bacterium]